MKKDNEQFLKKQYKIIKKMTKSKNLLQIGFCFVY